MRASQLPPLGLYRPEHERDSCGVGFVADLHGRRTHALLRQAMQRAGVVDQPDVYFLNEA